MEALPELEAELQVAEGQEREARERAEALRGIIENVKKLNGHAGAIRLVTTAPEQPAPPFARAEAETAEKPAHPVGRTAVRAIVSERPGIWTLADLVAELERRGWLTNRKATEVAVHRLMNSGEARRVRTGVYEFPATAAEDGDET